MLAFDTLLVDLHVASLVPGGAPYGGVRDAAVGIDGGRIAWVGPASALPDAPESLAPRVLRAGGGWLTPGLIDCHTHLMFGGDRVDEFERRLGGASYEEIARGGGGIRATVRRTRAASEDTLLESARVRLARLVREGVTTVEVKSGYGLETDTELRMLRVARRLGAASAVDVQTTLLAAHALPPEEEEGRAAYLARIREEMIPLAHAEGLVDAVDAFCERIAFTPEECAGVFEAATRAGIPVRLHADQLSDSGGAALAARFGARSADHLEHTGPEGVRAMAEAGTVAVLLPGAFYFLRERTVPPVEQFRASGVPIAVATDLNPGSSPLLSLLLAMNMGCVLLGLTPEEALAGVTRHAARALGMHDDRGTVEVGKRADLALWAISQPAELAYWMGGIAPRLVIKDGVVRTPDEAARSLTLDGGAGSARASGAGALSA